MSHGEALRVIDGGLAERDPISEVQLQTPPTHDELIATLLKKVCAHPEVKARKHCAKPLTLSENDLRERAYLYAEHSLRRAEGLKLKDLDERCTPIPFQPLRFKVKALKITGQDHLLAGTECQDEIVVARTTELVVVAISDGAGAFASSHLGAKLIANRATQIVQKLLDGKLSSPTFQGTFLTAKFLSDLYCNLYLSLHAYAGAAGLSVEAAYSTFLPATLQLLIITPFEAAILALADGYISWNDAPYQLIEEVAKRPQTLRDANHPPLLVAGAAFDDGAKPIRQQDYKLRCALEEEARAFYVVAHGMTNDLATKGISMASDGLRFTLPSTEPEDMEKRFPLTELLTKHSDDEVNALAELYNLAVAYRENKVKDSAVLSKFINSDVLSTVPALRKELCHLIAENLSRLFSARVRVENLENLDLGHFVRTGIVGDGKTRFEVANPKSLAELVAPEALRQCLLKHFGINTYGASCPIWDDLTLVSIAL